METQVGLAQETSDGFLASLRESDTQFRNMNPKEFRGALEKYIGQQWGSPACKAFTSTQGAPSWVVDLSDVLGGLVYYAVVTTGSEGRHVAGFVDEDQVAQVVQTGQEPPRPEAPVMPEAPAPTVDTTALEALQRELEQVRAEAEKSKAELNGLKPKAADPVLVRHKVVKESGEAGDQVAEEWVPIATTHGEAGQVVGDLLAKGVQPSAIEIWSRKSSPRVTIEW